MTKFQLIFILRHIQEHMQVPIDTSKMSEAELQFHYFKMHDSDNNNKLDGCELIKSLIHWHGKLNIYLFSFQLIFQLKSYNLAGNTKTFVLCYLISFFSYQININLNHVKQKIKKKNIFYE